MRRWISLAALTAVLALAAPALAGDFPFSTNSTTGKPSKSTPLFGNGGVFFPWLKSPGTSGRTDTGKMTTQKRSTSSLNSRGTRTGTGVLPDLNKATGKSLNRR